MSATTLSFVVVNWGEPEATLACLSSIAGQRVRATLEAIVVDNASTPRSRRLLAAADLPVRIIAHRRNLGFAAGANSGLEEATGEFVAIVNNDCVLASDWARTGLEALADPAVGLVGGLEYDWDDASPAFDARNPCRSRTVVDPHWGFTRRLAGRAPSGPVMSLDGCSLLARKEVLRRLRGFEPAFFTYYEDVDLCARCWAIGCEVRFVEQMATWHRRNLTSDRHPVRRRALSDRNHALLVARHFPEDEWRPLVRQLARRYLGAALLGADSSWRDRSSSPLPASERLGHLGGALWIATHGAAVAASRRAAERAGEHDEGYRSRLSRCGADGAVPVNAPGRC